MRPKYRVEVFIVPETVSESELSTSNEIDDVKIANSKLKLGSPLRETESVVDESRLTPAISYLVNNNNTEPAEDPSPEDIYEMSEPIYDVPCIVKSKFQNLPTPRHKYDDKALSLPPKIPVRTSSLVSIDERGETDGILEEFCFHGYKNGCTAPTQRPEEVSEEFFQDNWLRRLENLREREASLGQRETLLQERERLLFKKERELRILERLVREKLKQAEFNLKSCQSSGSIDSTNFDAKTRSSEGSSRCSQSKRSRSERTSNSETKSSISCASGRDEGFVVRDAETEHRRISRLQPTCSSRENFEKEIYKNPPSSKSSLWTSATSIVLQPGKDRFVKPRVESTRSSYPNLGTYSSVRMAKSKIRPRISYDDLDSTLSADIGDSSFVVTSKKFDPAVFKKPHAFARSSSERRARHHELQRETGKDSTLFKFPQHPIFQRNPLDDKILKRIGENIAVIQDEETKYQDYGLIDERTSSNENDEARNSCPNLERGISGTTRSEKIVRASCGERPNSWNEEGNEWLRKKRQAYNMANMRTSENIENKENAGSSVDGREKLKKNAKNKDSRTKKFGIFR